ncbi:ABC transporter permease [Ensifer soli]|uniref:ABC transporter permease n=1 Tax=Ciceribacter sp. sgz301302 TaxID=3342379 RepID=UPI0035B96E88
MTTAVLTTGLSRQSRIISALMIRELRMRKSKSGLMLVFDLLEALGMILFMWILFVIRGRSLPLGDSLLVFIATGVLPVMFFRSLSVKTASGIEAAKSVTFVPYIQPLDYAIARLAVEFITFVSLFMAFFWMIHLFDLSAYAYPFDLYRLIEFLAIIVLFSFGIGLVNSFIIYLFPLWKIIWSAFARLQMILAGVYLIPEYVPEPLKTYMWYNPIMHLVALFRTSFYPMYPTYMLSIPYILLWTACLLILGLMMERALRNRRAR